MEINFKSRLKPSEVSSTSILIIIISFFPPALYNFPANEAQLCAINLWMKLKQFLSPLLKLSSPTQ